MNQKIFRILFVPAFFAVIILLCLADYRQYAIIPVLLFWVIYFIWDSKDKKKNLKGNTKE